MSERYLLLVGIGPVQEFLAQARRTRDLWFGSRLLSDLARTAARVLAEEARLVYPALEATDPELEPCLEAVRESGRPPLGISNKVLAEVIGDPEPLARRVRREVHERLRSLAEGVRRDYDGLLRDDVEEVWSEQIDSLVEFGAAWLRIQSDNGGFVSAFRGVEQRLAGRKALREFRSWTAQSGGVPKSSFDGARETVLARAEVRKSRLAGLSDRQRRKADGLRISEGEQLDAVGLIKRAGGRPEQFVPIANVALAGWIGAAAHRAPQRLENAAAACRQADVGRVVRGGWTAEFPFDAQVFLANRWKNLLAEAGSDADAESWGREHIQSLLDRIGQPHPYLACLVADGDEVGAALSKLADADSHRAVSAALAEFADSAWRIVEERHRGSLVYAGGDDVLAFIGLGEALDCSNELRKAYERAMSAALPGLAGSDRPTISIGLGVGHLLDSMGELLELGREALALAKAGWLKRSRKDRDALAVIVDKRSGGRRSWRAQWAEEPVAQLSAAQEALAKRVSKRKVYEIRRDASRFPIPELVADDEEVAWRLALKSDVSRTLARTDGGPQTDEPGASGTSASTVGLNLGDAKGEPGYEEMRKRILAWVDRILIAHEFSAAAQSAVLETAQLEAHE